jgi:hypothetical protein
VKRAAATLSILAVCAIGCHTRPAANTDEQSKAAPVMHYDPEFRPDGIMQKFRERASSAQLKEYDQLRSTTDPDARERALELVLFTLTPAELRTVSIQEVTLKPEELRYIRNSMTSGCRSFDRFWLLAGAPCVTQKSSLVGRDALNREGICYIQLPPAGGLSPFAVPREHFFKARRILLTLPSTLRIQVLEPSFAFR